MKFWVGTSGFSYKPWVGSFYPDGLALRDMLRFYASRLPAVEINNTFYRMPNENVLQSWAEQVPVGFRFVLKAPQRITHVKRLKDTADDVGYFFRVAESLAGTAGPTLFQLPPNFKKDLEILQRFISSLPSERAIAFEFRHPSWFDEQTFAALRQHNCALCRADTDESEISDLLSTASWGYLRLRRAGYSAPELVRWKERVLAQDWSETYVFFKHEDEGIGPKLAAEFLERLAERGE